MNFKKQKPGTYGENNGNAKLTAEKVKAIRRSKGLITQRELSEIYGVTEGTISRIQRRDLWKHIKDDEKN